MLIQTSDRCGSVFTDADSSSVSFFDLPENEGLSCHGSERIATRSEKARERAEKVAARAVFRAWLANRKAAQARWEASCPALAGRPGMNALNAARKTAKDQAVIALGRYMAKWRILPKVDEATAWNRAFDAVFGEATPFSAPTMRSYKRRAQAYADSFFGSKGETTPNARQVFEKKGNKDSQRTGARGHPHRLETPALFRPSSLLFFAPPSSLRDECASGALHTVQDAPRQAGPRFEDGLSARTPLGKLPPAVINLARVLLPRLRHAHPFGCPVAWHSGAALAWLSRSLAAGKDAEDLVAAYGLGVANWAHRAHDFAAAKREAYSEWNREGDRPAWLAPSGLFAGLYAAAAALPTLTAEEVARCSEARRTARRARENCDTGRAAAFLRGEVRERRRAERRAKASAARAAVPVIAGEGLASPDEVAAVFAAMMNR